MKNLMRNTVFGLIVFSTLATIPANALLPPFYGSRNEYRALINSPELEKKLGSAELIYDIERTDQAFIITTTNYTLIADIVYDATGYIGPASFTFKFHEPVRN